MIVFATGLIVYRFSFDHDAIIAKKKTAANLARRRYDATIYYKDAGCVFVPRFAG
jgi:hypothetical protein